MERFRLLLIKLSLFFFSSNICFGNLNLLPCRRSKGKKNTIQLVTRPSTDKIIQNSRISLETGRFPDIKKTIKRYLFDSSKRNFGTKRVQLKISSIDWLLISLADQVDFCKCPSHFTTFCFG